MAKQSPQTLAKNIATAVIRETRAAGWDRLRLEIRPDNTVSIDAKMVDAETEDDFLNNDLRMGK